ncbi:unnamed protein product [Parascedosporium putredinis]|uniref:Arylsulfotransferase n=1 Tax=Parascedosporium putredinis TaxID=1442378 RepID=A0A9P1HBX6_9PEZI|nr:unnamed protein product [Parascedosporium putredinis]CAI8004292.1 unnamed protein product [Parascedosporium putredinis]
MTRYSQIFLAFSSLASIAQADWRFRSRPEFAVPRLNITVPADKTAVEEGYIFIAPYEGFGEGHTGPVQAGAYIYRDDGELVWSGLGYHAGWVANFRPVTWNGQPHLRAFQGRLDHVQGRMFGFHTLLGSDYEVAKVVTVGSHRLVSAHEFHVVDEKTALIETPIPRTVSLKPWGGDEGQNWVVSGVSSAFPLDFGPGLPGDGRTETEAWNYFHINSIDKDDEGNYLLSARNVAAVFKINGTSGEVIWQLGGFHGGTTRASTDAPRTARSSSSLFDNGAHSADVKTHPHSRARFYELNRATGEARNIRSLDAPDALSARTQGNVQLLPGGNVFVNWGQAGAITEFSRDGAVSYRGFRANWTGTPTEEPAVVAVRDEQGAQGALDVYVSWNGDTETRTWRFFGSDAADGAATRFVLLGEARRLGFETHVALAGAQGASRSISHVSAVALDAQGKPPHRTGQEELEQWVGEL